MSSSTPPATRTEPRGGLDRYFSITRRGSTVGREIRGGVATFIAMSYIVVLNPLVLGYGEDGAGNILGGERVAAMTALVAGVLTILMGVWAKSPFGMATGLGVNAFLAVTIATNPGLTWPEVMGLVIWAGVIMVVLVLTGFRTAVFNAVPDSLKTAIVVGIGLFIALIGFVNAGFVRRIPDAAHTTVPVQLGNGGQLFGWPTLTFVVGLLLTMAFVVRNVKGGILISVVLTTILKNMKTSTYEAIMASAEGELDFEPYVGTLENDGVGIADFHNFEDKVSDEVKTELEDIRAGIIDGSIEVKSYLQ